VDFDTVGTGQTFQGREPQFPLPTRLHRLVVLVRNPGHLGECLLGKAVDRPQLTQATNQMFERGVPHACGSSILALILPPNHR